VSLMDRILIRMALSELLHCPTIPVKVTINEYIDISKAYSTPKSKDFINGVLDNLLRTMKEEGLIKKIGRGLVE
ncbi:MAG: N utilization substance protein B, partial [Limisphaerales bacterium]